jgi:mRNA interferase MazF
MERGEIYWFEPDPVRGSEQAGRRPALLLSRDSINRVSPVVVVLPLTTYRGQALYPSDVLVRVPEGGLVRDSVALGLHVRAVSRERLGRRIGRVGSETMRNVERALLRVLDIDG